MNQSNFRFAAVYKCVQLANQVDTWLTKACLASKKYFHSDCQII